MDNKTLLSTIVPIEAPSEDLTQYEVSQKSIVSYELYELIDNVGKPSFKNLFLNFIDDIRNQETNIQKEFCYEILKKIQRVYHIEFSENIHITSKEEVEKAISFIRFIEFDSLEFLIYIWLSLQTDLSNLNIDLFFIDNKDLIIKKIDQALDLNIIENFSIQENLFMSLEKNKAVTLFKILTIKNIQYIILETKIRRMSIK
jgi:hypothetical protein